MLFAWCVPVVDVMQICPANNLPPKQSLLHHQAQPRVEPLPSHTSEFRQFGYRTRCAHQQSDHVDDLGLHGSGSSLRHLVSSFRTARLGSPRGLSTPAAHAAGRCGVGRPRTLAGQCRGSGLRRREGSWHLPPNLCRSADDGAAGDNKPVIATA